MRAAGAPHGQGLAARARPAAPAGSRAAQGQPQPQALRTSVGSGWAVRLVLRGPGHGCGELESGLAVALLRWGTDGAGRGGKWGPGLGRSPRRAVQEERGPDILHLQGDFVSS